jgi:hypothetical protein
VNSRADLNILLRLVVSVEFVTVVCCTCGEMLPLCEKSMLREDSHVREQPGYDSCSHDSEVSEMCVNAAICHEIIISDIGHGSKNGAHFAHFDELNQLEYQRHRAYRL